MADQPRPTWVATGIGGPASNGEAVSGLQATLSSPMDEPRRNSAAIGDINAGRFLSLLPAEKIAEVTVTAIVGGRQAGAATASAKRA